MTVTIGRRARILRERIGLSQAQAAERAGLSQATWSRVESDSKHPTAGEVLSLSWALGVSLDTMRGKSDVRDSLRFASRTATSDTVVDEDALAAVDEQLTALMEFASELQDEGFLPRRG